MALVPGQAIASNMRMNPVESRLLELNEVLRRLADGGRSATRLSPGLGRLFLLVEASSVSLISFGSRRATSGLMVGTQPQIINTLTSTADHMKDSEAYPV